MSKGIGFGKVILFGEHFVVYGLPGLVAAVEMNTTCSFEKNEKGVVSNDLVTKEKIVFGKNPKKMLDKVLKVVFEETKVKPGNFRLKLTTNMSLRGGLGSSAALGVAIARCLNEQFNLKMSDEKINDIAFKVEKLFHGNPSGIDNTASTYGGLLEFGKSGNGNKIEKLKTKEVEIVLADTGIYHDTGELVAGVKERKEKEPQKYAKIFKEYEELYPKAKKAVLTADWLETGRLMNKNHELLKEMEVSCPEIEDLCNVTLKAGALGAKLTGAGVGGNIIALTPGKKLQEKVAKECKKLGFKVYKTKIGV
ncbi:MAG TPA: mevalonate kinase [archaeon]|nr:mevalonate kinase [archaeon]